MKLTINNLKYEELHRQAETEILYIIKSGSYVKIENAFYKLMPRDIVIINSGELFSIIPENESIIAHIQIEQKELDFVRKDLKFFCNSSIDRINDYSELRGTIRDLIKIFTNQNANTELRKKGMEYILLDCLIRNYIINDGPDQNKDKSEFLWNDVYAYIRERVDSPISLDEVSKMMFMSKSSFSRFFKQKTGMNFSKYLIQSRIDHAVIDLEKSEKSISQIASEHGFSNSSAFSSSFRKFKGISPTLFRSNFAEKNDESAVVSKPNVDNHLVNEESSRFTIKVDARKNEIVHLIWGESMGLGNARDLLDAYIQKQVLMIKNLLNAKYLTLNNILNLMISDDNNIVHYNLLERILAFCVESKIKPVFVLGHVNKRIVLSQDDVLKTWPDPRIKDEESLFLLFLKYIIERFGAQEVTSWILRVYYVDDYETKEEYLNRLKYIYVTVKQYLPDMLVGQCSYIVGSGQKFFSDDLIKLGFLPDFFSITAFPYEHYIYKSRYSSGNSTQAVNKYIIVDECKKINKELSKSELKNTKFYVSEWNLSISDRNAYNDSVGKAAHMLDTMIGLHGEIDFECYCGMFDLSYDYNDEKSVFFGGRGIISHKGILKPSFYALYFMSKLGKFLIRKSEGYIITTDGNGEYDIILTNAKRFREDYYRIPENNVVIDMLDDIYEDDLEQVYNIELTGLTDGDYLVKRHFLNEENDILSVLHDAGKDIQYKLEDFNYFRQKSLPEMKASYHQTENGNLDLTIIMKKNQIEWIHIAHTQFLKM